jgi:ribosomal protein S12 methylthiotransferase accessory factor
MMLQHAGHIGAIDGSLDLLVDESVGIIRSLDSVGAKPGAPAFRHCDARLCNTGALGGLPCVPTASAAAVEPHQALTAAVSAALSFYSAALYDRAALPLASFANADFPCVRPSEFALFSETQYARPGFPYVPPEDETPLRWASAIDLATGEATHVPAALVFHPFAYRRAGGDKPIAPPGAGGLACARGMAKAALAGLADVVCRDAMALFWQAMTAPPQLTKESLPPLLREMIHRFEATGDRVFVLDITTDNTVPAFAAMLQSERLERPAIVCDAGADLDPEAAVAHALTRLAATRRRCVAAPLELVRPTPANDWQDMVDSLDHLLVAADHANRTSFDFALASDIRRDLAEHEPRLSGAVEPDLETMVRLVSATGHRICAANLTTEDLATLGIAICRVVVPGYRSLHATHGLRTLEGDRLYEVPQRLGYRGIARGAPDNPFPHPFAV